MIRYADDFVILHHELDTLLQLRQRAEEWPAEMGLNLKQSKTCITHTLNEHEGYVGFDFLGFNIRQFKTGRHITCRGYRTVIKPSKDANNVIRQRWPRSFSSIEVLLKRHSSPNSTLKSGDGPLTIGLALANESCPAWATFSTRSYAVGLSGDIPVKLDTGDIGGIGPDIEDEFYSVMAKFLWSGISM